MWKSKKDKEVTKYIPITPQVYPSGICVRTTKEVYLVNDDGKRYRIPNQRILDSWNFPIIVDTTESSLVNYPVAVTKLGFRNGSLLNNIADGKLYLVSGSKARHITSPDVLTRLGVTKDNAIVISDAEINYMNFGEDIY